MIGIPTSCTPIGACGENVALDVSVHNGAQRSANRLTSRSKTNLTHGSSHSQ